ncbi:MAG: hypothetical protein R2728_15210 [Chitinophagales bacterium]
MKVLLTLLQEFPEVVRLMFLLYASMMEAALQMESSQNVSKVLVSQTFTGAIELLIRITYRPIHGWKSDVRWLNHASSFGFNER